MMSDMCMTRTLECWSLHLYYREKTHALTVCTACKLVLREQHYTVGMQVRSVALADVPCTSLALLRADAGAAASRVIALTGCYDNQVGDAPTAK